MNELAKKAIIKRVIEKTNTDYSNPSEIDLYLALEELCNIDDSRIETIQHLENQRDNDYDPDLEIPMIHGKGISW